MWLQAPHFIYLDVWSAYSEFAFAGRSQIPQVYHLISSDRHPFSDHLKQSMHTLKSFANQLLCLQALLMSFPQRGGVALNLLRCGGPLGESVWLHMRCDLSLPAPHQSTSFSEGTGQ